MFIFAPVFYLLLYKSEFIAIIMAFLSLIFMRMKFSTLLAASMLLCSSLTVSAVETDQLHGSLDFNNVLTSGAAQVNAPMAFTSDGNVLVTNTQYKNMQLSSFVAKTDKDMSQTIWNLQISGSSEVVAIVPDKTGGAFIGGNFNTKITLPGVDQAITLTGSSSTASPKRNAFIAHINSEGKVTTARAISTTVNQMMVNTYQYYHGDNDQMYCRLNSLVYANGQLYAGLIFTDILYNSDKTNYVEASTAAAYETITTPTFTVGTISMDDLSLTSFPIVFGGKGEHTDKSYYGMNVTSAKLIGDDSHLIFAARVDGYSGTGHLLINNVEKATTNFKAQGGMNTYFLANIELTSNSVVSKEFVGTYQWGGTAEPAINNMLIDGNDLYVSGSFKTDLPFKTDLKSEGTTDAYCAKLNKNSLDVIDAIASGYDETTISAANIPEERLSSFAVDGKMISLSSSASYVPDAYSNTVIMLKPISFTFDGVNKSLDTESTDYIISQAVSADGKYHYYGFLTGDQKSLKYRYTYTDTPSGISEIESKDDAKTKDIYTLQGIKLSAPQKGLNIIGGKKIVIK